MTEAAEGALVALGSNLGDPLEQLRGAAHELRRLARDSRWSSLYRTVPVGGPRGQPEFLNAVVLLLPRPPWSQPEALLGELLAVERRHGRERGERWGSRTLDLDLLAFGSLVRDTATLTLPHPRMMERGFVLAPLCEVAAYWRHPLTGEAACSALGRVGSTGLQRTRLPWWPR